MEKVNFKALRERMVLEQICKRGIDNQKILDAFKTIKRELFIPKTQRQFAYSDRPLPIGEGQTISQPYMVALMTQCLDVKPGERILEIGTGSGYQAAIISFLGANVYGVERITSLAAKAKEVLDSLGYKVEIKVGDGTGGWSENAPYDKIIITAGAPQIPSLLLEQIKIGGKIIIPLGGRYHQELTVMTRVSQDKVEQEKFCGCIFVPLIGEYGWNEFS